MERIIKNKDFLKAIRYIEKSIWKDNTPDELVLEIAKKYVDCLPKDAKKEKTLHRICGQSGSGKTTQILKSLNKVFDDNNIKICHLAVRTFAQLHPNYNQLIEEHGKKHIREKTNGFALKCLTYALKLMLEGGFLIVLEITLLKQVFEKLVLNLAKQNGYEIKFHMLAVSPKISDAFIQKRNNLSKNVIEGERLTYKSSSAYFNKILPQSFDFLCKQKELEADIVVWNAYDTFPCYYGSLKNSKKAFLSNRKIQKNFVFSEAELLEGKVEFYKEKNILF